MTPTFSLTPIATVHSCYRQKFGIPRQPGLVSAARGALELLPPYNRIEALRGLEQFSHLWVQFIFHQCLREEWKATVRPPRLGGNSKVGVFATRSTHRPNSLGLSVVKLEGIREEKGRLFLDISGLDLLDGTPVLDIKPYLPYADSLPEASGGFADAAPGSWPVRFSEQALQQCLQYEQQTGRPLRLLIEQVLAQDPRPAYHASQPHADRRYGVALWERNVRFRVQGDQFFVEELTLFEPEGTNNQA